MRRQSRQRTSSMRRLSISVTREDLATLKHAANTSHGGRLSALVHDLAERIRRDEATDELLAMLGGDRVTDAEIEAIRAELIDTMTPARRRA